MSRRKGIPYHFGSEVLPGLSKIIEEAGELLQVAGKILAVGALKRHYDGTHLKERLEDEIADIQAAILFFGAYNQLNKERMGKRVKEKLELFEQWHREQQ